MSGISTATLKKWGMEIGEGIWGTVQGAFNERQTTTQILVDAAIGMIPLVGDATAARDLLAVAIRLIKEPARRTQVMEWVLIVILIFALIPVVGGMVKGVGRIALKVGKDVAENRKILAEVIGFLNRVGHGNAQKWLKQLDVLKFQPELISKLKGFCESISAAISQILKSRIGKLLPDGLRSTLISMGDGLLMLRDLGVRMIPDALKELHTKLKVLQELVYQGEAHMLVTGEKTITREVENHLVEKEIRAAIKSGKWPKCLVVAPADKVITPRLTKQLAKYFDRSKIKQGWPDLLSEITKLPGLSDVEYYKRLATFSGKVEAWAAKELAGKTIFRGFGPGGKLAGPTNAQGGFWGIGKIPTTTEEWRVFCGLLDEWNANGFLVKVTFSSLDEMKKFPELANELKVWQGKISEQFGDKIKNQYLEGGGNQLFGFMPKQIDDAVALMGKAAKASGNVGKQTVMGVEIEVVKTGWTNIEGVHGYAEMGQDLSKYAPKTRRLNADEIRLKTNIHAKTTNSATVAAARSGNALSAEHGVK